MFDGYRQTNEKMEQLLLCKRRKSLKRIGTFFKPIYTGKYNGYKRIKDNSSISIFLLEFQFKFLRAHKLLKSQATTYYIVQVQVHYNTYVYIYKIIYRVF